MDHYLLGFQLIDQNSQVLPSNADAPTDGICAVPAAAIYANDGVYLRLYRVLEHVLVMLPFVLATACELPYGTVLLLRAQALIRERKMVRGWLFLVVIQTNSSNITLDLFRRNGQKLVGS